MLPAICMSQTQIEWKNFMVNDTLTADTNVVITTSGVYSSWNVFFVFGTMSATVSTVKVQVSPDNTSWTDYVGIAPQTITSDGKISFEDAYVGLRWMRFVFDIESRGTVPVNGWYVFKKR